MPSNLFLWKPHFFLLFSLSSYHLSLNNKLLTKILNLWTYALNACRQAWWIEIFTEQPKCTYYFGPFATCAQEAHVAGKGFVEDLEGEFAQGIKIKIDRHSQPDLLTIEHDTFNRDRSPSQLL